MFTELSNDGGVQDLYIVCSVIRIGPMEQGKESKKPGSAVFRRSFSLALIHTHTLTHSHTHVFMSPLFFWSTHTHTHTLAHIDLLVEA
jgi:hypothetical protein